MSQDRLTYDLISAVITDSEEQVTTLLNEGADPNHCLDEAQVTPLHYAAQNNALKSIPLLIESGANINAKTEPDGQTPIEIALLHQLPQVVQLLAYYQQHAKTHATDKTKETN